MNIATAIHYYEAILASLAIFVWHFYFVIYNPDVYPMNKAWFKGYLTREEMELEHPLELERIDEAENSKLETETENEIIIEKEIKKVLHPMGDSIKSDVDGQEKNITKKDSGSEIFGQYNQKEEDESVKISVEEDLKEDKIDKDTQPI